MVGACSPRTHEGLFQETVRKAGLNKYLVEIANLRDQDTWVHPDRPVEAAAKAKDLMRMAIASVRLARPLADQTLPMNKDILVVGGGVAGMTAALRLADLGYKVHLVERFKELGGVAKQVRRTLEGEDVQAYVADLIKRTDGARTYSGVEAIHGGGPLGHGRDVQNGYPGGAPDVLPGNPARHHDPGHRGAPQPSPGVPPGPASGGNGPNSISGPCWQTTRKLSRTGRTSS